jgi:hypothetical protein
MYGLPLLSFTSGRLVPASDGASNAAAPSVLNLCGARSDLESERCQPQWCTLNTRR